MGKHSTDHTSCDDFAVCGFYFDADNRCSAILGSYYGEHIVYQGRVPVGDSPAELQRVLGAPAAMKSEHCEGFPDFEDAAWLDPALACRVEFDGRSASGELEGARWRGLCGGKAALECRMDTVS